MENESFTAMRFNFKFLATCLGIALIISLIFQVKSKISENYARKVA